MANNRLYVGNLSWGLSEEQVRAAFEEYGEVTDIKLITDRDTGRPRGFGFVTMNTDEEAQAAIAGMDGQPLDGRDIRVNVAEERKPRAGGGGGGRGGFGGGDRGGRNGGGGRDSDRGNRW